MGGVAGGGGGGGAGGVGGGAPAPPQRIVPAVAQFLNPALRAVSDAVLAVLSRIVPADIVQKLVLLSIFALACAGAAALLEREPWFARLTAGVFYAWNPFVAERLIMGQWAMLLGYAGLPWVLREVRGRAGRIGPWRLAAAIVPAAVGGFAAMSITVLAAVPVALCGARGRGVDVARPGRGPGRSRGRRPAPGRRRCPGV